MASAREHLKTSIAQNQGKKEKLEHQLRQLKRDLDRYREFTYAVDEQAVESEPTDPGKYIIYCVTCNIICYENPYIDDAPRSKSPVMDNNGYCTVCPQNCHWSMHRNKICIHSVKIHKVTKTDYDLREKYEDTKNKIERCNGELGHVNSEINADKRKLVGLFTCLEL